MVTIKDLATKLGVSPSTITRALADNPRISAKTKRLVREAAAEMGYVADSAAKTMRNKFSPLIGLLIPDIENSFYARIAKAFSDVCNSHGFQLTLAVSDDNSAIEERHIHQLVAARCAGIAIVPTATLSQQSISLLSARNAAQLIRRNSEINTDWYGINDVMALQNATRALLELGHQRIGFICGTSELVSGRDRLHGYSTALHEAGIELAPELVMKGPPRAFFGQQSTHRLANLNNPPTAIIAAGAGLSEGMLSSVSAWRNADQQKISLIGYSDCNAFRWWGNTGLTAIDLPIRQIATDLCTTLIDRARSEGPFLREDYLYDSQLILRGSVHPC
ncbi:LacI family DNA-binding transcriptional regulator [Aestuariirhabdus sp. LZHN29]|uniref:LacI family DNA-binding transcriptional regulator n=1 Tax=Aestuariirhabdus sp. LZHN29 TaxID=3417462 RepID=UPI003CF7114A